MMDWTTILLPLLFLAVSIVYAISGQGGASAYLAILALFNVPYQSIPAIALSCNIVVTLAVVYKFYRAGHLKLNLVLPFLITSIPSAYIGSRIPVPEFEFRILLIAVLIITAASVFFNGTGNEGGKRPPRIVLYTAAPMIGILLGLLAGIVGIGGGIFLFPLILLLRWGQTKEAAVAAGFFTLINSVVGLVSHGMRGLPKWHLLFPLMAAVLIGGWIGSHIGSRHLQPRTIQRIFAVLLMIVIARLIVSII